MINICGYGFVGQSIGYLCKQNNMEFNIYDIQKKDKEFTFTNLRELVENSESKNEINYYFICVPTPSRPNGQCNTDIVKKLVNDLNDICNKETFIIIKSTVEPGTLRSFNLKNVVFVPEFLRAVSANVDMYNAKFTLFGTFDGVPNENLYSLFRELYKHNPDIEFKTDKYETYEIFKYTVNCFLATKVWFFNEIYEICTKFDVDYNTVRDHLELDSRIGMSHTSVPGPDGKHGYGGLCFKKDMKALSYLRENLNIPNDAVKSILKRNEQLRDP